MTFYPVFPALALMASLSASAAGDDPRLPEYRQWVELMTQSERGPFSRVVWFCDDGTVQPPVSWGCRDHGGGRQHGQWNENALALRTAGYKIANVLSAYDRELVISDPDFADTFAQILIEKYLVGVENGWILRQAMFYRGALQEEAERAGARRMLEYLVSQEQWLNAAYPALRTGVKLLPHGEETASIQKIRQVSASLSEQDPAFNPLRTKIHGAPDATDAQRVRDYANSKAPAELQNDYHNLAQEIDGVYQAVAFENKLRERASAYDRGPWLQAILLSAADQLSADSSAINRFQVSAALLTELRKSMPRIHSVNVRLQILDLSLRAELEHFRAATELRPELARMSRMALIELLRGAAKAAYGTGLINDRLATEVDLALTVDEHQKMNLHKLQARLGYAARLPGWGMQTLRMHFQQSMNTLARLEPSAHLFIQDQLRGSPLLFYSDVLDILMRDANRMAGVQHELFEKNVGFGLTALNPGMARGTLHSGTAGVDTADFDINGIHLLPETVAELPPIAGILTAGEGNPLSHIQLLARNLGIPNVVVSETLIPELIARDQQKVVLAVSPAGLVELVLDGARWEPYFASQQKARDVLIEPDLEKLDLSVRSLISLNQLRASDSGRIVGPKAAKLGELRAHYPDAVARGIAIPFGVFHQHVLMQAYPGDPSDRTTVYDWMLAAYRHLDTLAAGSAERTGQTEAFRDELYQIVVKTPVDEALKSALAEALRETFGPGESPGLFIRSDTNVEDLPGFTGAGLNLTLPNVVGFDALLHGIPRVWASPFTARAFAWRQSLMSQPEHVYTSILLLESVAVDKSGVLVTQGIETGDPDILSIAINEGPGGAVDGQAAESLRVPLDGSRVKVLATATAGTRRVLLPEGGVQSIPASGSDTVLEPDEIQRLIEFARQLPLTFPGIINQAGQAIPSDVEFGFQDGELRLFQIRPFLDSTGARSSEYLRKMDQKLAAQPDIVIDMNVRIQP